MSSLPTTTRQWVIRTRPGDEKVSNANFELKTDVPISDGGDTAGKLLLKITHISTDPAQRTWMDAGPFQHRGYIGDVNNPGDVVLAGAVAKVIHSYNPEYVAGDYVFGMFGWTEYALIDLAQQKIFYRVPKNLTPEEFLGLDLTAQSAYFAFMGLGKPTKETAKTVVVSSAAGGVGTIVAQLAKNVVGAQRVVGIVGTDDKAKRLLDKGFVDVALNYKDPDFDRKFEEATPDYVDIYFDNVGGHILDLNLNRIAKRGKVIACGAISLYERDEQMKIRPESWMQLIYQGASVHGFLVLDFIDQMPEYYKDMFRWKAEGKIEAVVDVKELKFEQVPEGLYSLLKGQNFGKNLVKLVD